MAERSPGPTLKRRDFIGSASAWLTLACSAREPYGNGVRSFPSQVMVDTAAFPQSVASGDPKPNSVVLWTRVPDNDIVFLQVSLDAGFERPLELSKDVEASTVDSTVLELTANESHDHCVKVRVDNLAPATTYYYRFIVETDDGARSSLTGRTKTAPTKDADTPVRFVVLSCQDYSGRYYHSLRQAAELAPDFVVHLGDYIYETTDDPRFQQQTAGDRSIAFRDVEGAEVLPNEGSTNTVSLAARSLDNYRQLYQVYRSDRDLQRLHEIAPFIVVWDDHEFANDATRDRIPALSAADPTRRSHADQAWFEYMPVDFAREPTLERGTFPDNLQIYRDFRFGRHVHLVLTDLRRFRPPPLISEDAFPGSVLVTETTLVELYGDVPEFAAPYVDLDAPVFESLRAALREASASLGVDGQVFAGNQDVAYLNTWIARLNDETKSDLPMVLESDAIGRGVAVIHVGKTELRSSFGARYFVIQDAYEAVALAAYRASNGESENVLGATQRAWFVQTLQESDATWKVWGNEYTFLTKTANLEPLPLPDPSLKNKFLISVDDWDGVPNERLALLSALQTVESLVVVTGDIHSFFVGSTGLRADIRQPIEFVCGAVSSATYDSLLANAESLPQAAEIAPFADAILKASNPHVKYQDLASNGFALVEANAESFDVTFYQLASAKVLEPELSGSLADHFALGTHSLDRRGQLS